MRFDAENVDKVLIEDDFVVAHKADRVHFMDKPHFHDGFEIHFTLTNGTVYQIDERKFEADAGSIALFSSEEVHRVSIDRSRLYERYFLLFRPRFIQGITINYPAILDILSKNRKRDCLELTSSQQATFIRLYDELIEINDKREEELNNLLLELKLGEILVLLNQLFDGDDKMHQPISYEHSQLISEIVNFIKSNYADEITLDSLAERFFVSKSTIIRSFKDVMGMTPTQYLIYTRIMESRKFLSKGFSVKEVAAKIGYKDESSFIKKFKEIQGESPKQYSLKIGVQRNG